MMSLFAVAPLALAAGLTGLAPSARAADPAVESRVEAETAAETETETETETAAEAPPVAVTVQSAPPAAPPDFALGESIFDGTWATIGLGAGLVPSYAGSNDYNVFPLPLIVGRVGGIGIQPNGPGLTFDLLSPSPSSDKRKVRAAFGPAFRIRNDRQGQIGDDVVEAAGELDMALEVGVNAAVAFPDVFNPFDTLTIGAQVRWDVLGAHDGMVIEPQVTYSTPINRWMLLQMQAGIEFVDGDFADYYFSVTPPQRLGSSLPAFTADGGLNRVGTLAILTFDLDRNALNGGWTLFGVGGYSRLLGDAADTPYTALRGSPNQFITGLGVGYSF